MIASSVPVRADCLSCSEFIFIHKQFLFLARDLLVSLLTLNREIKGLPLITGVIIKDIQTIAYLISLSTIGVIYP